MAGRTDTSMTADLISRQKSLQKQQEELIAKLTESYNEEDYRKYNIVLHKLKVIDNRLAGEFVNDFQTYEIIK